MEDKGSVKVFSIKKIKWQKLSLDLELSILLIALLSIGTSFIYSASSHESMKLFDGDSSYFFNRQIMYLVIGLTVVLVASKIRYQSLRGYVPLLNIVTVILNFLVFLPAFNKGANGATRWIDLFGLSFQPSELAKITLIITLAHMLEKRVRMGRLNDLKEGILPISVYIMFMVGIVVMQKHMSASGVLIFIALSMFVFAGLSKKYIAVAAVAMSAFATIAILAEPFRVKRIFSFLDPYEDKLGGGHQIIQSLYAFAGGGWNGLGLGMSRQKFDWLPEAHTDFILAVIGEELGFVGIFIVLGLFLWFIMRGLLISYSAPDDFGVILGIGIVSMLFFQIAVNVSVVSGMFPVTGMVLPFISFGGTSTIILMSSVGILLNIASQKKNL